MGWQRSFKTLSNLNNTVKPISYFADGGIRCKCSYFDWAVADKLYKSIDLWKAPMA